MAFIFNAMKGETPATLARRRAIVDSLMTPDPGVPRNVGEGIAAIGKAPSGYFANKALHKKEMELQYGADARWNEMVAALQGPSAFPSAPGSPTSTPSPQIGNASSHAAQAPGDFQGNGVFKNN